MPLCLLTLVGTRLGAVGSRIVVIVAAAVAVLAQDMPAGTGLLVAVVVGAGSGLLWDRHGR